MRATRLPQKGDVTIDTNPLMQVREPDELRQFAGAILAIGDDGLTRSTVVEYLNDLRGVGNGLTVLVAVDALDEGQREYLNKTVELLRSL